MDLIDSLNLEEIKQFKLKMDEQKKQEELQSQQIKILKDQLHI